MEVRIPLSRDDIGHRVVVRRRLRGESGPSGGPAFSDTLGYLEEWDGDVLSVRRSDGEVVAIPVADVVGAKRIPPPPRRR